MAVGCWIPPKFPNSGALVPHVSAVQFHSHTSLSFRSTHICRSVQHISRSVYHTSLSFGSTRLCRSVPRVSVRWRPDVHHTPTSASRRTVSPAAAGGLRWGPGSQPAGSGRRGRTATPAGLAGACWHSQHGGRSRIRLGGAITGPRHPRPGYLWSCAAPLPCLMHCIRRPRSRLSPVQSVHTHTEPGNAASMFSNPQLALTDEHNVLLVGSCEPKNPIKRHVRTERKQIPAPARENAAKPGASRDWDGSMPLVQHTLLSPLPSRLCRVHPISSQTPAIVPAALFRRTALLEPA